MVSHQKGSYYLPQPSRWPIVGSIALFCIMFGAAQWLHEESYGPWLFAFGIGLMTYMMFGWFGNVIAENQAGLYDNRQLDRSFRWGMFWFIFSEVIFFGAFFGALFYSRFFSVNWLAGEGTGFITHLLLWPSFEAQWPLLQNPDATQFIAPRGVMETWEIPALNTLILLTSGLTITIAHWGLIKHKRFQTLVAQGITILLGVTFLLMQAHEYSIAYLEKGLTLGSGIYGSTFFMLTGFHALHVTIGTIMLVVMFYRIARRHFDKHNHFAFEAAAWYWHFVDVVWLFLFVFVYWI